MLEQERGQEGGKSSQPGGGLEWCCRGEGEGSRCRYWKGAAEDGREESMSVRDLRIAFGSFRVRVGYS